jgi:hypothetical protein
MANTVSLKFFIPSRVTPGKQAARIRAHHLQPAESGIQHWHRRNARGLGHVRRQSGKLYEWENTNWYFDELS